MRISRGTGILACVPRAVSNTGTRTCAPFGIYKGNVGVPNSSITSGRYNRPLPEQPTPDISLILPAYNEARVLPGTIAEAVRYFDSRSLRYEIIVAADGNDGT